MKIICNLALSHRLFTQKKKKKTLSQHVFTKNNLYEKNIKKIQKITYFYFIYWIKK